MFDIARRTSWYKQRCAQASDFPLEALERGETPTGAGGQAEATQDAGDAIESAGVDEASSDGHDGQQRLDAVADTDGNSEATAGMGAVDTGEDSGLGEPDEVWGSKPSTGEDDVVGEASGGGGESGGGRVRGHVREAIASLRSVEESLDGR